MIVYRVNEIKCCPYYHSQTHTFTNRQQYQTKQNRKKQTRHHEPPERGLSLSTTLARHTTNLGKLSISALAMMWEITTLHKICKLQTWDVPSYSTHYFCLHKHMLTKFVG